MTLSIPTTVAGIPCRVKVFRYKKHHGTYSPIALDPEQFYGWVELDYRLYDRKGYRADWLEEKLDNEGLREEFERILMDELDDYYEALWEDKMEAKMKGEV